MSLAVIARMFGGAARAAAKGTQAVLSRAGPAARKSLQALSKFAGPALKRGFKYARNVSKQSVKVLKKKERLAGRVARKDRRFWRWGNRKLSQINRELVGASPQEAAALTDERKVLQTEQSALQHLKADEQSIISTFKQARRHDLKPLLKKSNYAAKMAILEDKQGAIDPRVLETYANSERSLLQKIGQEEAYQQQVEKDEFQMMKILRSDLMREYQDLKVALQSETRPREVKKIKRRMKQVLAELYMIKHALHLAEKEDLNEQILRQKSKKIYGTLEGLKNLEAREKAILGGRPATAQSPTAPKVTPTGGGFFRSLLNLFKRIFRRR